MAGRVRQPFDVPSLERWIDANVPAIKTPLEVKQFGFGQSNPTYQLTSADGSRYVLRKKPPGKLLSKTAHKVEREYRIIEALGPTDVPVPKAYCLCEDDGPIGTPFYIMEFLDGRIIEDPSMPGIPPAERSALWQDAARTLAKFHAVDFRKVGLGGFGQSTGFYDRQLATWKRICATQEQAVDADTGKPVGAIPHFDEMSRFFADKARQPRERATLVHGDYKLDNMVFHPTEARVIGVLDWEMSTVGHPLSDLANLTGGFVTAGVMPPYKGDGFRPGVTPGLPTAAQIVGWYADEAAGRSSGSGSGGGGGGGEACWDPAPEMGWAVAFNTFRASAICQGIAARYATRQASSEKASQYAESFQPLGEFAWSLVQKETGAAAQPKL